MSSLQSLKVKSVPALWIGSIHRRRLPELALLGQTGGKLGSNLYLPETCASAHEKKPHFLSMQARKLEAGAPRPSQVPRCEVTARSNLEVARKSE
jgi:hypothetical protein